MPNEPITCEYLVDSRLCKAIAELPEGRDIRERFCKNIQKDYCCYLCSDRENCKISCSFLDSPREPSISEQSVPLEVEREIKKYEEEKCKLSVLFADGKIGEQSYLAAIKILESKIEELKESSLPSSNHETVSHGVDEFEKTIDLVSKPTALWYLVPFFFGIIGGIVAYVGTKDDDEGMANNLLLFGIGWSIVLIIIYLAILASI